jgi:hypothetical protein
MEENETKLFEYNILLNMVGSNILRSELLHVPLVMKSPYRGTQHTNLLYDPSQLKFLYSTGSLLISTYTVLIHD